MNSIVEAKVADYLRNELLCDPYQVGNAVGQIRSLARMAGYGVDQRFGSASLGAGPEARIASAIVNRATGGGGGETSAYAIRQQLERWVVTSPSVANWMS